MKNIKLYRAVLLFGITVFFAVNAFSTGDKPGPNVIVILNDDQGYADVGFEGCTDIPTPIIDRIANNGVKFTNGYVTYAVCSPSRAGCVPIEI